MAQYDLTVTAPPHLKTKEDVSYAMRDVLIALIPIMAVSIGFFRLYAVVNLAVGAGTAVLCELIMRRVMGRKATIKDCSAIVTGLLLALLMPPTVPFWYVIIGTVIAVAIVKELMGGLGFNLFNPALLGFVSTLFLSRIWEPVTLNLGSISGVTGATPLTYVKPTALSGLRPGYWDLFLGNSGGALSEVSVLAILVGAAYLLYKKQITWHIPVSIIASAFVLTAILGENPLYMVLAGGLMLGAFFMATDWVTSPDTVPAMIAYGILIGVLIVVIRLYSGATGAVAYSILIGNAFTPLLNRLFSKRKFGEVKSTG
ncbi:MAG: RnfABCDGE type electron transport complex subunit D [Actinomycetota bacterium]|nr:RnfABCDGE type electron transport complex subunit D [Actinomycetota bacterium]